MPISTGNKTYEATGVLGYETDTLDVHVSAAFSRLHRFRGNASRKPRVTTSPTLRLMQRCIQCVDCTSRYHLFTAVSRHLGRANKSSAKKCRGRRLRDYAAKKIPVEIKPCKVIVYSIERLSRPSKVELVICHHL